MKRFFRASLAWFLVLLATAILLSCAAPAVTGEGGALDPATPPATGLPAVQEQATASLPVATAVLATPTPATFTVPAAPVSPPPTLQGSILQTDTTPIYTYQIVNIYPHDREAFTQGLVYENGFLYEGTGLNGRSSLRRVELETGEVLQIHELEDQYFGEGITIWQDRIVQLTWQSGIGFVYDKETFAPQGTFTYTTQGWGITHDGSQLIMSDGSATLYLWDPETFAEIGQVQVYDEKGPVNRLNELEYIDGLVYANVWLTDRVAIIDPQTGQVMAWIDLSGLLEPEDLDPPVDVLNGIAYDPRNERLFVTGKLWPKLFEIEVVETPPPQLAFLPLVSK